MMKQVTRSMGIQVGEPQMVRLPDDKIESYVNSLKQLYHDKVGWYEDIVFWMFVRSEEKFVDTW